MGFQRSIGNRLLFTEQSVGAIEYSGDTKAIYFYDQLQPGLVLCVTRTGLKIYQLYKSINGRTRRARLGEHPKMTPDDARNAAVRLEAKMRVPAPIVNAIAPLEMHQDDSKVRDPLFSEFCELYLERYSKLRKKSWKEDARRMRLYLLPALGNFKLSEITRPVVSELHDRVGTTKPFQANRLLENLSRMFEMAARWGYYSEALPNPARRIDHFDEKARDRFLHHDELPRLVDSLSKEPDCYLRAYFWMLLLTGCRKQEMLDIKWKHVDLAGRMITISDTKNGNTNFVCLSDEAVEVLSAVPKKNNNDYVFCGAITGRPLVQVNKAWRRVRERAGLGDVRIHDLRHTVGSWLAQNGVSLQIIGLVLNQTTEQSTAVYAHLKRENAIGALSKYGEYLSPLLNGAHGEKSREQ